MILVNFSNQIAAGPKNISKNFIEQAIATHEVGNYYFYLPDIEDYRKLISSSSTLQNNVTLVATGGNILQKILRTLLINLIMPAITSKKHNITAFLSFGNFLLYPGLKQCKVVLLHHPYLVDDALYNKLSGLSKIAEKFKRIAFYFTAKNVTAVIVQSEYMASAFLKKFPLQSKKVSILSNPLSATFEESRLTNEGSCGRVTTGTTPFKILYVSRYYPHKNHKFLLDLARTIKTEGKNIEITVTINPHLLGAGEFIAAIKNENLPIKNAGEVEQKNLIFLYKENDIAIFPSLTETFGNPLIEAMCFSLPVLAVDLPYAKDILGDAGVFYDGSVDNCLQKITGLQSEAYYKSISDLSYKRSLSFPSARQWYIAISNNLKTPHNE